MYEVVGYRNCDCGYEFCPGEKQTVLFEHKDKSQCVDFMMRESLKDNVYQIKQYNDTKDKIDIYFYVGKHKGIKRLRVQNAPISNSNSDKSDLFNKGYEVNQK
jgi:hypothetical protein